MYIAMVLHRNTHTLLSFGEGATEAQARQEAIYNLPCHADDVLEFDCEWEIEKTED